MVFNIEAATTTPQNLDQGSTKNILNTSSVRDLGVYIHADLSSVNVDPLAMDRCWLLCCSLSDP